MAFYRNKLQFRDLSATWQKLYDELGNSPKVKQIVAEDPAEEAFYFYVEDPQATLGNNPIRQYYAPIMIANYSQLIPCYNAAVLILRKNAENTETVSPSHIRLPKLSHLITLTPEDFFLLLVIIDTAKLTAAGNSFSLNLPSIGVPSLDDTNLARFFTPLVTNYRISRNVADRKWTPIKAVSQMAQLPPYAENQLYAMQYFTILQNKDVFWMPEETAINLELDPIDHMTDGYCEPHPEDWIKY